MGRRWVIVIGVAAVGAMALGAQIASATFSGTDGRIAFQAFVEATESVEIYTATPDGGDVQQLTSSPGSFAEVPDWSPDGQRIAFHRDRVGGAGQEEAFQIYVMNADGSDLTELTRGPGFHGFPAWSPDSTRLAIDADWGKSDLDGIWIIPASDPGGVTQQEARRLTTVPAGVDSDAEPQFSPDGARSCSHGSRARASRRSTGWGSTGPASSVSPSGA